jgi:hypothetical protein
MSTAITRRSGARSGMTARAPSLDIGESHGLDYDSARDATPRWFAVSSGNGNDGVSHSFPDYYCRCTAPQAWDLAGAAMISNFQPAFYKWAVENISVDGEAEYTITACIYDPPDDETAEDPDSEESWSSVNGAWMLIDVFPADETDTLIADNGKSFLGKPAYQSLADCFDDEVLKLAAE